MTFQENECIIKVSLNNTSHRNKAPINMALDPSLLTESVQTYLINTLRLAEEGQPVPLSRLAAALDISPISVNQMCRRLQDEGLLTYIPYKGASLTPEGERLAAHILRRHRLWEVFLVERLQMTWDEAHEAASQLEHGAPDEVVERLDVFLGHPRINPQGDPIPPSSGVISSVLLRSLAEIEAGQKGHFVQCTAEEITCAFLAGQGLRAGAPFQMVAVAPKSVLVEVNGQRLVLSPSLAMAIQVARDGGEASEGLLLSRKVLEEEPEEEKEASPTQVSLDQLTVGQRAIIVKVGGTPRLRNRLLEMGMVPGELITVERMAPLGDPVEFTVKGYRLSLRKKEAAQILVELEHNG